jgi:hypothetical protein
VQICSKEAESLQLVPAAVVNYFLEFLSWALRYEFIAPKAITVEFLDKTKEGTCGSVHTTLAKMTLVMYLGSLVDDQALANPNLPVLEEVRRVLGWFEDYHSYSKTFRPEGALATTQGPDVGENEKSQGDESGPVLVDENEVIEGLKQGMSKVGTACLDFLYDTFAGQHDSALRTLATSAGCGSGIQWSTATSGDFGTALHELVRLLGLHKQAVGLDAEAPPMPGTRQLRRYASEEDKDAGRAEQIARERQEVWRHAQQLRRKFVNVAVCRYLTAADLQRFFEMKCGAVYSYVGKPAEAPALAPRFRSVR